MRSPALITACSKAGCHAVLASLSGRYPPLEGRSPTCYSPVCHSTHPFRDFRVRLACVRHAASVDSEPGSNSHVKFAAHPRACALRWDNSLTRGRFGFCVVQSVIGLGGSPPVAFARTDNFGRPIARRHPLTLIVPTTPRQLSPSEPRHDRAVCACTHYLVFKEPTTRAPLAPGPSKSGSECLANRV